MKAVAFSKYGDSSVNTIVDLPMPKLNPRDVLVEVAAVASNPIDWKTRENFGATDVKIEGGPKVIGWDAAGVIKEVGSKATLFKVGDRVLFQGSYNRPGCFSQFVAVDERIVGVLPASVPFDQAAALPLTATTAWESLLEELAIPEDDPEGNAGKTLLIVNGAGGVGSIAIQIAKKVLRIGTVIATASRSETIALCKKLGADHIINHRKPLKAQVDALGIKGAHYVFNCHHLDQKSLDDWVSILHPFGKIVNIDIAPKPFSPSLSMGFKRISLHTEVCYTRSTYGVGLEKQGRILTRIGQLLAAGAIDARVTKKFDSMKELSKAQDLQKAGAVLGKIVIMNKY